MLSRRTLFKTGTAFAGITLLSNQQAHAFDSSLSSLLKTYGKRIIPAQAGGVVPGKKEDQSAAFQRLLNLSAERDAPVFLPAGIYRVGGITLPRRTRIIGVPGATRLSFSGRDFLIRAERADVVDLHGIVFDGLGLGLSEEGQGLVTIKTARDVRIRSCAFIGSKLHGVDLSGAKGLVTDCRFRAIGDTAIYSKQSRGMTITGNDIAECGNGGILVTRFTPGDDGSIVTGNRIAGVKSVNGGTGQWGNGINVYQAHNVMVANNHIKDCALSAVRANGTQNLQMIGNHCSGSGETALYVEFIFEGAVIANNIVDGGTIGISLANFNEGGRLASVTGNVIRNLTNKLPYTNTGDFKPGIGIYAEADTTITGNVVENAPQAGIHIGWGEYCRNVIASQNIIRAVPWGITASVVKGSRNVMITNNMFGAIAKQAITGFEWVKPVTGELLRARRTGYDHLIISGNARL